jgi:hypothetical protein
VSATGDGGPSSTLILTASDGAGSAEHSAVGSHVACSTFVAAAVQYLATGARLNSLSKPIVDSWILNVGEALRAQAYLAESTLREFACTLVAAVISPTEALFAQVGDGGIVIRHQNGYEPVFWPASGEYANSTYFLTDINAEQKLQWQVVSEPVSEAAVFTDGLQSLALHYATRSAHGPFFRPLFDTLRREPAGESTSLTAELRAWLSSPKINERTDDDKTLILATRIPSQG